MTCPTIITLHAILAAHEAPAGPSKADTLKAVAECLSGACAPSAADTAALFDVNSPLWAWVNEKNIGRAEWDRRSNAIDAAQSMLSGLSPSCAAIEQHLAAEAATGAAHVGELRAMGRSAPDLSAAILNLPCATPSHYDSAAKVVPYRMGHLDARHAAARLARQAQPVAAHPLLTALQKVVDYYGYAQLGPIADARIAIAEYQSQTIAQPVARNCADAPNMGAAEVESMIHKVAADSGMKVTVTTTHGRAGDEPVAAQGEQNALLIALEGEHAACDWLMARLIALDPFFKPATSPAWPAIAAGSAAILAAKGGAV